MVSVPVEPILFIDMPLLFFGLIAVFMVLCAIGTVFSSNPLYGVLCLVGNLLGVSAMFAALGAYFLSTVQIAVYVGAITVLFLFVVMLLNIKVERENESFDFVKILAIGVGVLFVAIMLFAYIPDFKSETLFVYNPELSSARYVDGGVLSIGRALFTQHVFLFEAVSALLIVALVASVILASRSSKKVALERQIPGSLK